MSLRYRLLNMSDRHSAEEVGIINTCFDHWSQVFNEDLASRGAVLNQSDFHRARALAVLFHNDEMVGFHLYSVFDVREKPSLNHPYLLTIPDGTRAGLSGVGSYSLMAMEYLTILPGFRSRDIEGLRPGEIITRLGLKALESMNLDVAIGIARVDRKVNSMVQNIGFAESEMIEKFNNKCAIVYFDRHHHQLRGSPSTLKLIETVWDQRNGLQTDVYKNLKAA